MYPHTKFQLIWITSDFGTNVFQKNMNEKEKIEKINIKFDKGEIAMYHCIKFKSIWRTSDFGRLSQKTLQSGILRQTQPENNLK